MIVDTAWSEGYSVVVLVPVPEDADEWHGTVTFSHPILSANVSDLRNLEVCEKLRYVDFSAAPQHYRSKFLEFKPNFFCSLTTSQNNNKLTHKLLKTEGENL